MLPVLAFTIAGIIAGIGILVNFKHLMRKIIQRIEQNNFDLQSVQKDQSKYFIFVALVEAIPILLIVLGFATMEDSTVTFASKLIAFIIIIGVMIFAIAQIWSVNQEVPREKISSTEKNLIRTTIFIGLATIYAIPIISIIGIIII
ncbi:hypothetical protein SAMN04487944_103256 [Gracilibacillus ureilyticus]|uniref:Uncharacterized protein n=1 Tax=Gracilibacillus ureilyticus TaxID=531814 RepID=A0A1H9NQK4_9BACI|nr:hypothetical protein [Gracilibacillus ureilyticus]SER38027.1 hypothetical protein SAMN04487944_103256 [Gracilibacillus ureilyticus]